jgi:hypothetical protein
MMRPTVSFPIMRFALAAVVLVACHRPPPRPAEVSPRDATEAPVGAVPIPVEGAAGDTSIDELDRTVKLAELPGIEAAWKRREAFAYQGRVAIALHVTADVLELAVVDTVTETETGYPGALEEVRIASIDPGARPEDGNAFPARDVDPATGEYSGPIMFAIRALPKAGAPEAERHQWVVFARERAIFVADKRVTATRWTPQLRIELPHATEIIAINPGWH